jgi:hypothetical protein
MFNKAARVGDLENFMIWAKQGVRVTSAEPLFWAAQGVNLETVQCLVQELGADVNQTYHGDAPLIIAAGISNLAMVRCLIQLGAKVGAVNSYGNTALLVRSRNGQYTTTQYLLEEAGANIDDVNNDGETVWSLLSKYIEDDDEKKYDLAALTALLRVLVLHGDPPLALVALLSPEDTDMVQKGARLPVYLAHRRAYLDLRCPRISLLLDVLRALICTFEGHATTEALWSTGLGIAP